LGYTVKDGWRTMSEPTNIVPRSVPSYTTFKRRISPYGYYKDFARLNPFKRKRSSKYFTPGLETEQTNISNLIKESIIDKIKHHANRNVNEYMRSDEGRGLRDKVNSILKGKVRDKKKKL
jgi:hypothetical protein